MKSRASILIYWLILWFRLCVCGGKSNSANSFTKKTKIALNWERVEASRSFVHVPTCDSAMSLDVSRRNFLWKSLCFSFQKFKFWWRQLSSESEGWEEFQFLSPQQQLLQQPWSCMTIPLTERLGQSHGSIMFPSNPDAITRSRLLAAMLRMVVFSCRLSLCRNAIVLVPSRETVSGGNKVAVMAWTVNTNTEQAMRDQKEKCGAELNLCCRIPPHSMHKFWFIATTHNCFKSSYPPLLIPTPHRRNNVHIQLSSSCIISYRPTSSAACPDA